MPTPKRATGVAALKRPLQKLVPVGDNHPESVHLNEYVHILLSTQKAVSRNQKR